MDALDYLNKVKARAIELYNMSDQGEWNDLHPEFQKLWIDMAHKELRPLLNEAEPMRGEPRRKD